MSGFGSTPFGSGPWGSGEPTQTAAETEKFNLHEVHIWAADLLELVFSAPAKNNTAMKDPASYAVFPQDAGVAVTVRSVRSGSDITTDRIFLVISPASVGACYDVSVTGALRSTYNNALTSPVTQRVRIHRTKVDSMLSSRPAMYDLSSGALYRNVINAIAYQDHLIGGNILTCEED